MDACPSCERKFKHFRDFPKIKVLGLKRIAIPEIIKGFGENTEPEKITKKRILGSRKRQIDNPAIPKEILEHFRTNEPSENEIVDFSYQGIVYTRYPLCYSFRIEDDHLYGISSDVTNLVMEAIANPVVEETLSDLEELVGKEIETRKLLSIEGFKREIPTTRDTAKSCKKPKYYEDAIQMTGINLHLDISSRASEDTSVAQREISICLSGAEEGGSFVGYGISQELATLQYEGRVNPIST